MHLIQSLLYRIQFIDFLSIREMQGINRNTSKQFFCSKLYFLLKLLFPFHLMANTKSYHSIMHWVRCYKTFWCNLRFVHKAVVFSTIIIFISLSIIFVGKNFEAAIRNKNLGAPIRKFQALDHAITLAPGSGSGCGSDSSSWPSSSSS